MAARICVGISAPVKKETTINLSQLRRNVRCRKEKKSGRKRPRPMDLDQESESSIQQHNNHLYITIATILATIANELTESKVIYESDGDAKDNTIEEDICNSQVDDLSQTDDLSPHGNTTSPDVTPAVNTVMWPSLLY